MGRTDVILHSSDIRKHRGKFSFLGNYDRRQEFYKAINEMIGDLQFTILAVVILKKAHLAQYGDGARQPPGMPLYRFFKPLSYYSAQSQEKARKMVATIFRLLLAGNAYQLCNLAL